jgi:hypothetical protein
MRIRLTEGRAKSDGLASAAALTPYDEQHDSTDNSRNLFGAPCPRGNRTRGH